MTRPHLVLDLLAEPLAICRLAPHAPLPDWALARPFSAVARTSDELSVICPAGQVPPGVTASHGWQALRVRGPLDLGLVGVLAAVAEPLAAAGVSIMPVGTYDTDYVLVPQAQVAQALDALRRAGHAVHRARGAPDASGTAG